MKGVVLEENSRFGDNNGILDRTDASVSTLRILAGMHRSFWNPRDQCRFGAALLRLCVGTSDRCWVFGTARNRSDFFASQNQLWIPSLQCFLCVIETDVHTATAYLEEGVPALSEDGVRVWCVEGCSGPAPADSMLEELLASVLSAPSIGTSPAADAVYWHYDNGLLEAVLKQSFQQELANNGALLAPDGYNYRRHSISLPRERFQNVRSKVVEEFTNEKIAFFDTLEEAHAAHFL